MWVVGLVASASAIWMACGGDDSAVNGDDSSANDGGSSDATIGDSGNPGTDSGNPSDSGAAPDADDGGCHIAFPSLPAGEIVCPGAPGGECGDGGSCCLNQCGGNICISAAGHMTCERASDCKDNHTCCLKLADTIDLTAPTCPLTANATSSTCATINGFCPPDNGYVACASDAECDGGRCRALSVQVLDGGTILGVCAP